ncbi:geranylgeranyl reductase family protein [Umezawaea beigongshangensis]|uniref:geranylgeranyl reductase family protein n=1 Tax=Umezawaea beigongshangensis TaxID=2780383 RepID=UPI0018F2657E|nr:geranylgeranyl reductase family protein [Umezawaea beigongshangensis]
MSEDVWDVVVVGAGPAGASAARSAAENGARTLLLERAELPRYKTCGGGLIGPSLGALPDDLALKVRADITSISSTHAGQRFRSRSHSEPVLKLVYRDEFDAALVDTARARGVVVRERTLVREVEQDADEVVLQTGDGPVRARVVVGADGSASRLAAHVGVECDQVDLGLEVELDVAGREEDWAGRVHLDWGPLPGSYGWVFPKGDALTVGVISAKGDGAATRAYLDDLVRWLDLADLPVLRSSGHLTRCRTESSPLARGRVLVAGDAAGLLEPWTREGISFALRSGVLAGRFAASAAVGSGPVERHTAEYAREVDRDLGAEMRAGRVLLRAFEKRPGVVHGLLSRTRPGWRAFVDITSGRSTLARKLRHRAVRLAVRAISR